MSDLLEEAAEALDTPAELVRRSAAARAAASGSTIDEVLAAWAGGVPVTTAPKEDVKAEEPSAPEIAEPAPEPEPVTAPAAAAAEAPAMAPQPPLEAEPEKPLQPAPLRQRVRTAVRVGAWTGTALGFVGFLIAAGFWAPTAAVAPESAPVVTVGSTGVLIGVALVSILFGAIVAALSRAAASWTNPAMQLSNSQSSTAWIGGASGLVLGLVSGAILSGLGTPVEGIEGVVQLPVLSTLVVMLIGGSVLGSITAAIPQFLGTPVAVEEEQAEEAARLKQRLSSAVAVPVTGLLLLLILVLPFAFTLLQSNELAAWGAPVVAVLAAGGILGFAALAGNSPRMRISFGELMVAIAGIATVLLIILAVLFQMGGETAG